MSAPYIRWRNFESGERIHPADSLSFRASSCHLPSVALRERGVIDLCGDEGGSLETADPDVPTKSGQRVL
jgi:hypothetical protein